MRLCVFESTAKCVTNGNGVKVNLADCKLIIYVLFVHVMNIIMSK